MCEYVPSPECNCTDYLLPKYEHCHPLLCHNASICKLRKLLDEPMSANCYEQQMFYLMDYLKFCKCGFFLSDLLHLTRVLEVLAGRLDNNKIYRPYLKKLLDIAALPLFLHDCKEELTEAIYFSEYMSVLGLLVIWLNDQKLRTKIYKAIVQLITKDIETKLNTVKLSLRHNAVKNSHLPEIITQLLEIVCKEEYYEVLNISLILSQISPTICEKMVRVKALDYLLLRLLPEQDNIGPKILKNETFTENYLKIFNISCQILTNLVNNIKGLDKDTLEKLTPSGNSFWAIRYMFRGLLYGKNTQLYRNNLLVFIMLCLDIFPYIKILECDLANDLILLSVATEKESDSWIKEIIFTNSEYDISFKKMLILTLSFAQKYPLFYLTYNRENILPSLLKIISSDYETNWQPKNQESLIIHVLTSLYYIAPKMADHFVENDGILSLLIKVEAYIIFASECTEHILVASLKVLVKLVETKNLNVIETIRYHSGYSVLIMLCEKILKTDLLNSIEQDILSYTFYILSYLNDKPIVSDGSIKLLQTYFTRVLNPSPSDPCANPRTIITAINYLWEKINVDDNKLTDFIKTEGVYLLLDIIDQCVFPVKVIALGCLVDMCENGLCIPFLLTWRGGANRKIIFSSLLASIFRQECKKIGTRLNANDIIIDIQYPLMGKIQYLEIMSQNKDCNSCSAITDLLGSSRPKIYALLQLINTRYEEKTELTNEHYKIANIPIPRNDRIILHLAKNYFALKLSEAWHELYQDLINSNLEPTNIDLQMLLLLTEQMQKWNESVKEEQEAILQSEINKDIFEELKFYKTLKTCRLQSAIDALREMKYFASTTDTMFRLAQKQKQMKEILKCVKITEDLRRTYKTNLNVTVQFHENYNVQHNFEENNEELKNKNSDISVI